jgi:hypothetical protein
MGKIFQELPPGIQGLPNLFLRLTGMYEQRRRLFQGQVPRGGLRIIGGQTLKNLQGLGILPLVPVLLAQGQPFLPFRFPPALLP